ncbi:uncharacterized protein KY384_000372 [Bacidia gigantensis]|uniref:uncharacterized protein n=1 Tax=Bacidia gigantensis TaxID=2732470 RepID=UPI001D04EC5A|nr:uncharacterized protein KY384_000372 [Bacidia gigantensis]KAG8526379.1 hypothetical protein KY384_000372 [Bacidia gigantensis]
MVSQVDLQKRIVEVRSRLQSNPNTTPGKPPLTPPATANLIDHTLVKTDAAKDQIDRLCDEAKRHSFCTVCVRPQWVKCASTQLAIAKIGVACAGKFVEVFDDIAAVQRATPALLKVILETSQLTEDEIVAGCVVAVLAGADYVKTSTGFCGPGATVEVVRLMRRVVEAVAPGGGVGVKASGGVRTFKDLMGMVEAGASRIGTSNGVAIMEESTVAGVGGAEPLSKTEGECLSSAESPCGLLTLMGSKNEY